MQLDSYLEIFTTMYGWAFANIIGEVITGTGLVVLPFAIIIFQGWREAKEQGLHSAGVLPLLERVQTRLVVALFVMSVCFATSPLTSLHHTHLSFTPQPSVLDRTPETGSRDGGTGSGFDAAMSDASDGSMSDSGNLAFVPAWWYSVMAISSGVNTAVRAGVKNGGNDIRLVEDMARTATIEDPQLLHSIQRFYSECFIPARSRFLRMDRASLTPAGQGVIAMVNKDYGPGDVDWMGSQLFRTEPGFYADMRSYNPVPGFAVDFSRDTDYYNPADGTEPPHPGTVNPEWGRPTCKQWWEDADRGVRKQMITHSSVWQKLREALAESHSWFSFEQRDDALAKLAQAKANPAFIDQDRVMGSEYDLSTSLGRTVAGGVSTFGVVKEAIKAALTVAPLTTALPMMQALVLMGLYMFLPLVTFFSGFDLRVMFYGAVAIFTVKLWAAMWVIAQWIDARLIAAMYPGNSGNVFLQELTHIASGSIPQGYKRMILNILMLAMFVGLPFIWTAMMGWIGIRIGSEVGEMISSTRNKADQSASKSTPRKMR
ncbi:conjugal transfer protein TraG [Comamonadaceae bacterium OH2545_COT-014]|nr:conjugal transfer protein TraG [Comamonadaceae bacterium OH2545_COT-014]